MKLFILHIIFFLPIIIKAQPANEWINYDQSYFKFPISQDGIYRIDFQQIVNAGINVSDTAFDPRKAQIFAKGKEIPIYISGELDGVFGPNDFIEFYGESNTGWYDHTLFSDSTHNLNPHVSMFSDTLYHYLTWNSKLSNKRIKDEFEIIIDFDSYTPMKYFWDETVFTFDPQEPDDEKHSRFNFGQSTPFGRSVPEYSDGEGRFLWEMSSKQTKIYTINTPNKYDSGPAGWIKTKIFGLENATHYFEIEANDSLIYQDFFNDRKSVQVTHDLPSDWIEDIVDVKYKSTTSEFNNRDKVGIAYIHLRYAKEFNMGNQSNVIMHLPLGESDKDLIEIENFDDLNSTPRLYDLTGAKRIQVVPKNGKYYALIPNIDAERKCLLTTEASIRSVSSLRSVSTGSSKFHDFKKMIQDKEGVDYLLVTGSQLIESAKEYGEYRDSSGLKTIISNVEQLYDQFSFGIRKHPMSIRNYANAIINHWGYDPTYMFLCGKSISVDNYAVRLGTMFEDNIVPTWGVLGADAGFTSGLKLGTVLDPAIATGRLSVTNEDQLRDYLRKVKDYESAEVDEWMKQILHFGGGYSENEQTSFKNHLLEYENIIEDSLFGGYVHTFLKNTSDPLQLNFSDSVTNLINNGVSLMTFFGHAYGSNFDQSIDDPENYQNSGRYPFILANSCLIGNVHSTTNNSGSENFVLSKDKGAIGFLGSSSLGVPTYLYRYSREFYKNVSTDFYGWPLGKIVQQTIKDIQDSSNVLNRDVAMHMTLHCDPAIILNSQSKPDFTIYGNVELTKSNLSFSPKSISSELDSFDLEIEIKNLGKVQGDTFVVLISRNFPGLLKSDTTYVLEIVNESFSDFLNIRLPVDKYNGVGLNLFSVELDGLNQIDELDEFNNKVEVQLFINSSDIIPTYPYEYSIVSENKPILKSSTGNPYANFTKYYFQIDTSGSFDSPSLIENVIYSSGGIIEWDPSKSSKLESFYAKFNVNNSLENPQVFFWRVSADSSGNNGFNWKESSFQYVADKTGWGQSKFKQFEKNDFLFIDYDKDNEKLKFIQQIKKIKAKTHLKSGWTEKENTKYEIDGDLKSYQSKTGDPCFFVAVIDRITLEPWNSLEHGDYGHLNFQESYQLPAWNLYNFYFPHTITGLDNLMSFYEDVPDSNYILFYTFEGNYCSKYLTGQPISERYEQILTEIGASTDSLKNYPNDYPYILFFKKGNPNSVIESFSPDGLDYINLEGKMFNSWWNGTVKSTVIGPSSKWSSLHWDINQSEEGSLSDSARISLYGLDIHGKETLIIDSLTGKGDVYSLSDSVAASLYPYLKLESFFADDVYRTPNELSRWQVTYDEIPEVAINPLKVSGHTLVDSVQQGEEMVFITAIENISKVKMDSIQVSYRLIDNEMNYFPFNYKIKQSLGPSEVIYDTIKVSTTTLIGSNNLWYEINPYLGPRPWQLEQYHFNNSYLHNFKVYSDDENPLLDVTFDGVHILNGDIVNPESKIIITLDDENQFLELDDPHLVKLYLKSPSTPEDSVPLIDPNTYTFIPGNLPNNKCKIELQGKFTEDGMHELRVMASDKSSNKSGDGNGAFDYRISFNIITESSISQLINYPNPFSTSTRFVFTLTGSDLPDNMLIKIMTITGKVVREITQDELGPIKIGRNITEYEWDGTDEYGDKLANGVYLYKVQVQKDGSEFKKRDQGISTSEGTTTLSNKFFKKGIGKMYILR